MKALISLAPDGRLLLEFPACSAWAEHSILLPPTVGTMKHIIIMLSYQETGAGKLAERGAPTQAIIDAWLKQEQKKQDETLLELAKGVDL